MLMVTVVNAQASIEFEGNTAEPTPQELSNNRACFEELEKNGCGDPGEDVKQFRSCMHNVYSTLGKSCQKLMTDLYSRK